MSECNDTCKYYKHCWSRGEGLKEDGEECVYYEPERPHGEWIKQFDVKTQYYTCTCSVCGDTHRLLINYFLESNFCPNCGADMREGDPD